MRRLILVVSVVAVALIPHAIGAQGPREIDACKYLVIADFTTDPYDVAPELRKQAATNGFVVFTHANEVPTDKALEACVLSATWSAGSMGGRVQARVLDFLSGTLVTEASASGTAWWTVARTVRGVVSKLFQQIDYRGYREDVLQRKIQRLYPPRPRIAVSEIEIRTKDRRDQLEGIWSDPEDRYRIGIVRPRERKDADYSGVILRSATPTWQPGEVKIEFRSTASPEVFTATYYMVDKRPQGTTFILERDAILRGTVRTSTGSEEIMLIRVWPTAAGEASDSRLRSVAATGTGFFVNGSGLLATNWHVISGAREIEILLHGAPEAIPASVVLKDATNDLALLRVVDARAIRQCSAPPFQLKPSAGVALGQKVSTLGYPLQSVLGVSPKYAEGVIASKSGFQDDPRCFQVSTQVQPGSSGSPLFDAEGNVVGIVVATLDAAALYSKVGALPQDVNWAVKSDYLLNLLSMLPDQPPPQRSGVFLPEKAAGCVVLIRAR